MLERCRADAFRQVTPSVLMVLNSRPRIAAGPPAGLPGGAKAMKSSGMARFSLSTTYGSPKESRCSGGSVVAGCCCSRRHLLSRRALMSRTEKVGSVVKDLLSALAGASDDANLKFRGLIHNFPVDPAV